MTRNEFFLACFLVLLILTGVAYRDRVGGGGGFQPVLITNEPKPDSPGLPPAEIPPATAIVNINKADVNDLTAVPGIDAERAGNIVAFRERYGRFHDLRELMEVPGIDRSRYESLRAYVRLADLEPLSASTSTTDSPSVRSEGVFGPVIGDGGKSTIRLPAVRRPGRILRPSPAARRMGPVDLNRATLANLKEVNGIGDVLAQRILKDRAQRGGFESWQQVESVEGIGKTRLEALRKHFVIPQR